MHNDLWGETFHGDEKSGSAIATGVYPTRGLDSRPAC